LSRRPGITIKGVKGWMRERIWKRKRLLTQRGLTYLDRKKDDYFCQVIRKDVESSGLLYTHRCPSYFWIVEIEFSRRNNVYGSNHCLFLSLKPDVPPMQKTDKVSEKSSFPLESSGEDCFFRKEEFFHGTHLHFRGEKDIKGNTS
jgi:hypothetical protein